MGLDSPPVAVKLLELPRDASITDAYAGDRNWATWGECTWRVGPRLVCGARLSEALPWVQCGTGVNRERGGCRHCAPRLAPAWQKSFCSAGCATSERYFQALPHGRMRQDLHGTLRSRECRARRSPVVATTVGCQSCGILVTTPSHLGNASAGTRKNDGDLFGEGC